MPVSDVYDPREEQLRAQKQAIYESAVVKLAGGTSEFYAPRVPARLDAYLIGQGTPVQTFRELVSRCMFGMGTSVQKRTGYLTEAAKLTDKTLLKSFARYKDVDHLILNRQAYEETLGIARKSGFYRVVLEHTRRGAKPTVWPLPPLRHLPIVLNSEAVAQDLAKELNEKHNPLVTGLWWSPPTEPYTEAMLVNWLPPTSAF